MKIDRGTLESNIWKFYLFDVLYSTSFLIPIFQLYYLVRGFSITDIALFGVVFSVVQMLLEMPSGVLADKWGRKKTLLLAEVFFVITMIIMIVTGSFFWFALGSVFRAFWFVGQSGTREAFFYDTLLGLKRQKEFEKLWGRKSFYTFVPGIVASLLGGFLFNIAPALPYVVSMLSGILAIFVALSFVEPKFYKTSELGHYEHLKQSFFKIFRSEQLYFIVLLGAIFGFSLNYVLHYSQIYLEVVGVPVIWFGFIFAFRTLFNKSGALVAYKFKEWFSYRQFFTSILLILLSIIMGLAYIRSYVGILLLFVTFFIASIFRNLQRGYIHRNVDSHNRATVASVTSFVIGIIGIVFEPIAGKVADLYSMHTAFMLLGGVFSMYIVYYFIFNFSRSKLFE